MIGPDEAITNKLLELAEQADAWPWDLHPDELGAILALAIVDERWRIVRIGAEWDQEDEHRAAVLIEEWPEAKPLP